MTRCGSAARRRLADTASPAGPAPMTTMSAFVIGLRLLQAKLLARGEQADRFANPPVACLGPFSDMYPADEGTSIARRQGLKEIPRPGVGLQCRGEVGGQD